MAAYVVANVEVRDPERYADYRKGVLATIERYGGRFLARGGATEVLEGAFRPERFVIIEFPSAQVARTWWDSPEYRPLRELRQRASDGDLFVVEGV